MIGLMAKANATGRGHKCSGKGRLRSGPLLTTEYHFVPCTLFLCADYSVLPYRILQLQVYLVHRYGLHLNVHLSYCTNYGTISALATWVVVVPTRRDFLSFQENKDTGISAVQHGIQYSVFRTP